MATKNRSKLENNVQIICGNIECVTLQVHQQYKLYQCIVCECVVILSVVHCNCRFTSSTRCTSVFQLDSTTWRHQRDHSVNRSCLCRLSLVQGSIHLLFIHSLIHLVKLLLYLLIYAPGISLATDTVSLFNNVIVKYNNNNDLHYTSQWSSGSIPDCSARGPGIELL